ncbi:hypothetical protein TEA_007776 [Camellia sinensis var. sinensis]|uniref:Uncharacterized protein n=1 Tax=Camellia sinensis var. sinensis TaxID=542762 RepID=A0A4S4D143_CAMSN|nr:hypothetical protein TEA_007776 [Camellia sinensis var. sinensis]
MKPFEIREVRFSGSKLLSSCIIKLDYDKNDEIIKNMRGEKLENLNYSMLYQSLAFAEADTFFCFVELLSGFRDHFCQQLDNSVVGIRSTITKLSRLLKEHDEELWRHLEVTTKETLLRVCCAMLILIRRRLLAGDFTSNLKLLQHYPPTNISHLLYVANKLRSPSAH